MKKDEIYYTQKTITSGNTWTNKKFELGLINSCDDVYKSIFNKCSIKRPKIDRLKTKNLNPKDVYGFLDKHHGIDAYINTKNGGVLTIQEKILRNDKQKYNHLTWEYFNNPNKSKYPNFKDKGEWFKGISQLLFFAYSNENEDGFDRWYLINIATFKLFITLNCNHVEGIAKVSYNPFPAKANFLCFDWSFIEQECPECIIKKYNKNNINN